MTSKNFSAALLLAAAVWAAGRLLLPLAAPFLGGLALALAAEPTVAFLQRRARIPRGPAAGIGVSMTALILALAAAVLCAAAVREIRLLLPGLEETAREAIAAARELLLALAEQAPEALRPQAREQAEKLFTDGSDLLDRGIRCSLNLAGTLLAKLPDGALGLGTAVLSGYMLSARLPDIREKLRQWKRWQSAETALARGRAALAGYLRAQCSLMGVTFCILALGLLLLRVPCALPLAAAIAAVDALPVLGTGAVMVPWSLLSLLQGDGPRAVGLLGLYVTAALTRSTLEPRFVGRRLGLDPLAALAAIYLGYRLGGLAGMLAAPLLAAAAVQIGPQGEPGAENS